MTGAPVGGATVTLDGGGHRVRTTTTANGDALLEGVGDGAGSISVEARGFVADSAKVFVTQAGTHEVTVRPEPPGQRMIRVVGPDGKPVRGAIVELLPPTVLDIAVIAVADDDGAIRLFDAPQGTLSAVATAHGFARTAFSLPAANDAPVIVTLAPAR